MRFIILDTSSNFLYVAFIENEKEIFVKFTQGRNNHSENLLSVIEEGLKKTNLSVKDFDFFTVGIGPGSYTGLRVSLTVAKMFSWTLKKPLYTVSSLDILGSGHFNKDGLYAITIVAKKDHLYGKLIEVKNGIITDLISDVFLPETLFFDKIKSYPYELINSNNYRINPLILKTSLVKDLHNLAPNYLRSEL